jgi:hypothetical protein
MGNVPSASASRGDGWWVTQTDRQQRMNSCGSVYSKRQAAGHHPSDLNAAVVKRGEAASIGDRTHRDSYEGTINDLDAEVSDPREPQNDAGTGDKSGMLHDARQANAQGAVRDGHAGQRCEDALGGAETVPPVGLAPRPILSTELSRPGRTTQPAGTGIRYPGRFVSCHCRGGRRGRKVRRCRLLQRFQWPL